MYNIIPKFFCFCNNNLLCFMLFLFFLYFQSILKKLSTRCTSQFVGLWPGWGWGCRSEYGSQIQEYIPQRGCCNVLRHTQLWVKYTAKWGVWIEKWFSNTSQSSFRIVLLLFCYFFNYALFYFIFIQSFCFNQNCLKVYFYITIYFSEDFYCSFACFVVQSTLSRSLLHYRVVKCHLLDFIVCFSRFLFYKSYYYILYLP